MIRYDLKCEAGHGFDSWFASSEAYDKLLRAGCITCPQCGTSAVGKALMAPSVAAARAPATPEARAEAFAQGATPAATNGPATAAEQRVCATLGADHGREAPGRLDEARASALAALKQEFERRSEYVGMSFAAEARRMHAGNAPARPIHGEARLEEARALIEEGVPVAPLPFIPSRRTN